MGKNRKKLKTLIALSVALFGIGCIYYKTNKNISTNVIVSTNTNCDNINEETKQTLFVRLEDDPNAEDAIKVYHNTEEILKGIKSYPIRNDRRKVAYLTFDDGPSSETTEKILKILNDYNVKATFFVTGYAVENCEEGSELLKKIVLEGHSIGNHTYSHKYEKIYPGGYIDADAFMDEIEKCNDVIKGVLGNDYEVRSVRFPGGYWSWKGRSRIRNMLDEKGYAIVDWNALNEDAQGYAKNAAELIRRTKKNVERLGEDADSIVFLMHDTYGKSETVKSLPSVIEYFSEKGFEFKTIK